MDGKRLYTVLIGQTALLLLAIILLGTLLVRQGNRDERAREQLVEEVRANSEAIETVRSGLVRLAEDSTEVRDALMLPRRDYTFLRSEEAEGTASESNPFAPYFSALEALTRHNRANEAYREIAGLLESDPLRSYLIEGGIFFDTLPGGSYELTREGERLATVSYEGQERFSLDLSEGERIEVSTGEQLIAALDDHLALLEEIEAARSDALATLRSLTRDTELVEVLWNLELTFGELRAGEASLTLPVVKGRNDEVFTLRWSAEDERFTIAERRESDGENLEEALREYLATAELTSEREQAVDRRVEELEQLFEDPGFQSYLDTLGLSLDTAAREGEEYLYFDLSYPDGAPAGSLAIQRLNATVWIMDEDGVPITSLRRINGGEPERTSSRELEIDIPEITDRLSRSGEETLLVIGSHEEMADTVILVHVNHNNEAIQLISVPRDLYYRGRKINVLYPSFGGGRFAAELGEITGLDVSGYLAIDMYAFIDAVNIVGGIDVTLDEPLIDPTYRTKDAGRWSTLFYPAGTHTLSGIEALRLARSRHTSSDFGRAERQQAILGSLKEKLASLSARNMGTVYDLVTTLLQYVDTDLSSYELARLLTRSRNYDITGQVVLNTDNILYHTYSNLYYSGKSADEVDEDFYKGAWILLPKEDNWNAIRWYIRELLGEGTA